MQIRGEVVAVEIPVGSVVIVVIVLEPSQRNLFSRTELGQKEDLQYLVVVV